MPLPPLIRTRIYLRGNRRGSNDLWSLTLANGQENRMTRFSGRSGSVQPLSLAVGNTHLYFTWRRDIGDIWVMDVVSDGER